MTLEGDPDYFRRFDLNANAAVVTGDADFRQMEGLVPIEWLPGASGH